MVKREQIPEEWACLSPPSLYVMKELRGGPKRIVHHRGVTYIKDKVIWTSWNVIASLQMRGYIEQRKDGKWQLTAKYST